MARSDRVENPVVREYLYQYIPEVANKNKLFRICFGEKFASTKMRENVLVVYSNEPYSVSGAGAYHIGSEKSITFCCSREEIGNFLTPEQISKDKSLQETSIHESIHAMLERTEKECKEYGISSGTGLLEHYRYANGIHNELGRGLNEGYTEWLCEKLGFDSIAYKELTNFVRLIEIAIGTEKTMELGKGGSQTNFPRLLDLTEFDVRYLLTMADYVYTANDHLTTQRNLLTRINRRINKDSYSEETQTEIQDEWDDCFEEIDEYSKDPVFLNYLKEKGKENTLESLRDYFNEVSIPQNEEQKIRAIVAFESFMLEKYFMKDLKKIFESETISDENFEKMAKINSILNSKLPNIPDDIKNAETPASLIVFKNEFKKATERYVQQLVIRLADKYKQGELGIKQLVEKYKLVLAHNAAQSDKLLNEFAKLISKDEFEGFDSQFSQVLKNSYRYSDSEEYIKRMAGATIYKLVSANPEQSVEAIVLYDKENFLDRYQRKGRTIHDIDGECEFDFTAESGQGDEFDEYKVAMQNFLKLKQEVYAKNPNAKIHIASREIIVEDGEDIQFYEIQHGEFIPMRIEGKAELKFLHDEKEQTQEPTEMIPVKIGFWAKLSNLFRRKKNDFANRKKVDSPNYYEEGKIVFDIPETNRIDAYRVDDFDKRLEESRVKKEDLEEEQIVQYDEQAK